MKERSACELLKLGQEDPIRVTAFRCPECHTGENDDPGLLVDPEGEFNADIYERFGVLANIEVVCLNINCSWGARTVEDLLS